MNPTQYELDLISGDLKWSEDLYASFGYDKSEPANDIDWWTSHIHPEDAMILNQAMDKLMDPLAHEWTVEYRFRKADNSHILVQDHAAIVRSAAGNAVRLSGTLTPQSK